MRLSKRLAPNNAHGDDAEQNDKDRLCCGDVPMAMTPEGHANLPASSR
jgi:hypothetical protein